MKKPLPLQFALLLTVLAGLATTAHSAILFEDNFTGPLTWDKSDSSVYSKNNDFLYIGADGRSNDDWARKNLHIPLSSGNPVVIEQRLKLESGGLNYRLPAQTIHFEDTNGNPIEHESSAVGVNFLGASGEGWHFKDWTYNTANGVPGTGYWTSATADYWAVTRIVLTPTGGKLYVKPDDAAKGWVDNQFHEVASASWSHSSIEAIQFRQSWDSVNYVDYVKVTGVSEPAQPDPIDPVDPPMHTSQYNFIIGADPYFQWDGITIGLDFSLSIPTLDPITYNPSVTYPETPITPELSPWETRFSTNNKILGKALSLIAPVDMNTELTGTVRLSGDVDAIAGVGLANGSTQADFAAELGAGVNLGLSLTATNSFIESLPEKLQALIPNTFEFTYPIVGGNIGIDDVKIDHGLGNFDMQLFREALAAIPDDEYTSVDQITGAINICGVPMVFSDTNDDDIIDYVATGVGASLSVYAETSATAGVDVYFHEVDEFDNEVESTSIFTSFANLWNKGIDLLDGTVISSETGIVYVDTDGLCMQTGSPVWTQTIVTVEEETNLLAFAAEFLSEEGAEGILQIFCNGELVATIDERTTLEGVEEYIFSLPETLEAGDYLIAFRLDPFTEVASSIQIDNITLGYIQTIPEPSTVVLLIAGLIGVLVVRRRDK